MGGLFGNSISNSQPKINAVQYQQSTYGASKAIVYGTNRLTGNVIDCIDFAAIPHTTTTTTGKGGTTTSDTSYTYTANTLIGLCYGPIQGMNRVILSNTNYTPASLGMNVFNGTNSQTPWGVMMTSHPERALSYRNMAYIAGTLALGSDGGIPQYSFEINGLYTANKEDFDLTITEGFNFSTTSGVLTTNNIASLEYNGWYISDNNIQVNYQDSYGNQYTADNFPAYTKTLTNGIYTYNFDLSCLNAVAAHVYITYNSTCRLDANPKDIITDILTNQLYGARLNSSYLGDFTNYSNYCISNNLFLSPIYNSQNQTDSVLTDLANITYSSFVWSQDKLNIIPIGDEVCTANGVTYTPNLQPIYNLTFDDFKPADEPITWTRAQQTDVYNDIKVEYLDRGNNYNVSIAGATDQANIQLYGWKPASTVTAHQICRPETAHQVAEMIKDRYISARNTCTFSVNMKYILLDPMDLITVPTKSGDTVLVRILTIKEDSGWLLMTAEAVIEGTAQPALIQPQKVAATVINKNQNVGNVNQPIILEPPFTLTQGDSEVWIGISSPSNFFGGAQIWISDDNTTYSLKSSITQSIRQGILTSDLLASSSNPDTANALSVDISMSYNAELKSGTQADADNLNTLCYCDGELLAYETADLTDLSKYNLSYLNRGAYGTKIKAHSQGSQFARIDSDAFLHIPFTQNDIGKTIYLKICSFNVFNAGYQSLADVEPYPYKIQGSALFEDPEDVQGLTTYYKDGYLYIKWDYVTDVRPLQYEIRKGSAWDQSIIIGRFTVNEVIASGDGTYFIKAYAPSAAVYSQNATAISVIDSKVLKNVVSVVDEKALDWNGKKINAVIDDGNVRSSEVREGTFSSIPDFALDTDVENYGSGLIGYYETNNIVDVGVSQLCSVSCNYSFTADFLDYNFDTIADFDTVSNVDGSYPNNISGSKIQIALAGNDGVFGDWEDINQVQYYARKFKVRAVLISTDPTIVAVLTKLIWSVDMPDLIQTGTNVEIDYAGTSIVYNTAYQPVPKNPNLQITILGEQSGDYISRLDQSNTGFTIQISNGNNAVNREINYIAVGY